MRTMGLMAVMVFVCGCSMFKTVDANAWAKDFYAQKKTSEMIHISWKGAGKISIEADSLEFSMSAPVPPLSMVPREPTFLDNINPTELLLGWGLVKGMMNGPTVVTQPQPMVVEPMIVRP